MVAKRKKDATDTDAAKIKGALLQFVDCVDATGGVSKDGKGYTVPVADGEWIDLGEAYLAACVALGREPKVAE